MRADEARNDVVNSTEVEEPQEYVCIITQELMENPVIAEDGYSYEKEAIQRWMREHRNQSPMTRQVMDPSKLIDNRNLKDAIETYKAQLALKNTSVGERRDESAATVSSGNVYSSPKYSHVELMHKLREDLDVEMQEVYTGTVVEQSLVGIASIYTNQEGAMFRRNNESGHTCFKLKFESQQKYLKFVAYYNTNFQGFIIDQGNWNNGEATITTNSNKLGDELSAKLGEFKKEAHHKVMQELANQLSVEYNEVFNGTAVEQKLVGRAGINTVQDHSFFRMEANYTEKFNLSFASNDEYTQFLNYYRQNFPGFILNASTYNSVMHSDREFSSVIVNPIKLISALTSQIEPDAQGNRHTRRVAERNNSGGCITM